MGSFPKNSNLSQPKGFARCGFLDPLDLPQDVLWQVFFFVSSAGSGRGAPVAAHDWSLERSAELGKYENIQIQQI